MYVVRPGVANNGSSTSSDSQALRFKQIEALRIKFPNLLELHPGIVYDVRQPNGLAFRITLPSSFPHEAPQIHVVPRIQTPLVGEDGRVLPQAHEKLQHWNIHTDLGKLVFEVIEVLLSTASIGRSTLHPVSSPTLSATLIGVPPPTSSSTTSSATTMAPMYAFPSQAKATSLPALSSWPNSTPVVLPPPSIPQALPPPPPYALSGKSQPSSTTTSTSLSTLPPVTSNFTELEGKSALELEDLLNDPREFDAFFEQLEVVRKIRSIRDELRDTNQTLAKENIQKGDEVATLKFIIEEKKTEFNERRLAYEKKKERQKELAMKYRPERLAEELKQAAEDTERESDELASSFLQGQLDLKEFVKLYLPKRILLHQRTTKRDGILLSLK